MAPDHNSRKQARSSAPRTTTYSVVLGQVIAHARVAAGISQADLATAIGAEQSAVSRVERGELSLGVHTLARLARAVGMTSAEIVARADHGVRVLEARGVDVRFDAPRRPTGGGRAALVLLGAAAVGAMIALAATSGDD